MSEINPVDAVKYTNHLIKESSPYLLAQAHNPVDWYPWSLEALEKAKREDKPIFLSIGYAASPLERLYAYLDPAAPPVERGAAYIPLDWRGVWLGLSILAGWILLGVGMRKRLSDK